MCCSLLTHAVSLLSGVHAACTEHAALLNKPSLHCFIFQTLITFVNKHLNKLNLEVTELETQVGFYSLS